MPSPPSLSEADVAEMESFLDDVLVILPVLGLHEFERPQVGHSHFTRLELHGKGTEGFGYESDAGFVVLKGSTMREDTVASIHGYLTALRQSLGSIARFNPTAFQAVGFQQPFHAFDNGKDGGIQAKRARGLRPEVSRDLVHEVSV